jgi:hypothetical protein
MLAIPATWRVSWPAGSGLCEVTSGFTIATWPTFPVFTYSQVVCLTILRVTTSFIQLRIVYSVIPAVSVCSGM